MYDKKGDKEKPEKPSTLNVHPQQHKEEVVDNFKSPLQGELVKSFSKGKNNHGVQQPITPSETPSNETIYLCNFRVSVDGDWLCLKELDEGSISVICFVFLLIIIEEGSKGDFTSFEIAFDGSIFLL